jgi:hypothetical protein
MKKTPAKPIFEIDQNLKTGFEEFAKLYAAMNPPQKFEEWLLNNFDYLGNSSGAILKNWRNI